MKGRDKLLQAIIGSIFGVGLFLILADYFRIPFFATSKANNNLAKRQEKKTSTIDIWLKDWIIVNKVDKKIRTKRKYFLVCQVPTHGCMNEVGQNCKSR